MPYSIVKCLTIPLVDLPRRPGDVAMDDGNRTGNNHLQMIQMIQYVRLVKYRIQPEVPLVMFGGFGKIQ